MRLFQGCSSSQRQNQARLLSPDYYPSALSTMLWKQYSMSVGVERLSLHADPDLTGAHGLLGKI